MIPSHPTVTLRVLSLIRTALIASIIGVGMLAGSAVFANADDSPFYFDESGKMQMNGVWSPNNRRHFDAETDRRAYREWSNTETLRKNDETIREYHQSPVVPPASSGPRQFWVHPGGGQPSKLCSQSVNSIYCY